MTLVISNVRSRSDININFQDMNQDEFLKENKDFSIVLGGPFFQLLRKAHLTGDALELVKRRVLIITLVAWLPLLILSLLGGSALPGTSKLPFLYDIEIHVRLLVGLPLLIVAELIVHQRMVLVIRQFQIRKLVPDAHVGQFERAISSSLRLRNSATAEVIMLVLIYTIGYQVVWQEASGLDTLAWYNATGNAGGLSPAGYWFRFLSLPIWQFLFLRWYYRIFIWSRFLFLVSKMPLDLVPTHPDNAGGLGFLENAIHAFKPVAFAHGVILAGAISNHIFYGGASLPDFKIQVALVTLWVCVVVLAPFFFLTSQLTDAQRRGVREFGLLASRFTQEFESRWMRNGLPKDHAEVGGDIQSLSDLANAYGVVTRMKVVPIGRNALISLAVITAVPVAPLILTMMPLNQVIKMLAGLLF